MNLVPLNRIAVGWMEINVMMLSFSRGECGGLYVVHSVEDSSAITCCGSNNVVCPPYVGVVFGCWKNVDDYYIGIIICKSVFGL